MRRTVLMLVVARARCLGGPRGAGTLTWRESLAGVGPLEQTGALA
jgi:hypothetical protein